MTFEQWKARFDKEVSPSDIKVDWDCGHAYHFITCHNPAAELLEDFEDECDDYISEFMSDHGPTLYCVPYVQELDSDYDRSPCDCQCYHGSDLVEHTAGYVELLQREQAPETVFTIKLKQWVMTSKLVK